ncbi:MAG: AAA family ATPase [Leptolyngbya sp. SIO1E4]|nr:AAA family ATPase [Leptolyngbya sp. SIO1E4]
MLHLEGYQLLEELHDGSNSQVYRARRESDKSLVVLKFLRPEYPTPEQIARFRLEYDLTRSFDIPGIIGAYGLEAYQNTFVLILEDFGACPLKEVFQDKPLSTLDFLQQALKITEALEAIHQKDIIHKDINPTNILINPETHHVKIIDFGIATRLSQEQAAITHLNHLEGTLAYISPEQTGRMNRALDYRSDFYSLGVTFYEMLTQKFPFESHDVVELVHSHIARQPRPPHALNPAIPPILSQIVMRLLEKNAEARYQSAFGLKTDLQRCLESLTTIGTIAPFELGARDRVERFHLPQKLYGRETEVATLLSAFERASQGRSEVMLVAGYSGIGKSVLVQEIYKPITQKRGYFITGKFDQFQRNIPYSALIQAFQGLIRQLLASSPDDIEQWRTALLAALTSNAQVIIDVIPEVELIIGSHPPAAELSPKEAQNRFNLVFQNFIQVFTQREHPLVIFLDDLQWADSASLQLMQILMGEVNPHHLLFIGAYRDNEVDKTHPLQATLTELQTLGVPLHTIHLTPLQPADIRHFLQDTFLTQDDAPLSPLVELLQEKTGGNPFFMGEFLKSLHGDSHVHFDLHHGQWRWDLERIQSAQMTNNVVELMAGKIQRLSEPAQQALKLAACVGNQFSLSVLAIVRELPPATVAADLWEAMQMGLVAADGDDYKLLQVEDASVVAQLAEMEVTYRFIHDRVQQAAYSLIPDDAKQRAHFQVGQLLLQSMTLEQRSENIFDLVNQLNFGLELMATAAARQELAQLNLEAGTKAIAAAAYGPALSYLLTGIRALDTDCWQQQYALTLALHQKAAEAAFMVGDFEAMDRLIETVLHQASAVLDRIPVYAIQIQSLVARHELLAAIHQGLEVLGLLGFPLPENPSKRQVVLGLIKSKVGLLGTPVEHLSGLPPMRDSIPLAATQILASIASATYLAAPAVFPLTVFQQVALAVKYGNTPLSAFAYATYALILCGVGQDFKAGYRFGDLALKVLDRFDARAIEAKTLLVVNAFVRHWKEPLKNTLPAFQSAFQVGCETGDTEYASFAVQLAVMHGFYSGQDLAALEEQAVTQVEAVQKFKKQPIVELIQIHCQAIANLRSQNHNPRQLSGKLYDAPAMLPGYLEGNYRTAVFYIYSHCVSLNYWFEDYAAAVDYGEQAIPFLDSVIALFVVPAFYFYDALACLALADEVADLQRQTDLVQRAKNTRKQFQRWAKAAPANHGHKLALIQAEIYRRQGETALASSAYDRAIDLALANDYGHEAALANELAAKFYLKQKRPKVASVYLQDAHYLYAQWGATAKVQALEDTHPQLRRRESNLGTLSTLSASTTSTLPSLFTTSGHQDDTLDLATVVKASQTLSQEIQLDRLLSNLMRLLIENAGAQRGFLLLETDQKLWVEAQWNVDQETVEVLESLDLESCDMLSPAIVNYVARTQSSVVLSDATADGGFIQDAYIRQHQPRSVLCAPLINQGKLAGIVYLENNRTTGAFTADRLELLNLLSAQAAISIENARLYTNLATLNQELITLNKSYERFVPRQFLKLLGKDSITEVELGDNVKQDMSVLFSDIRDFTSLSERMSPEDNFRLINAFLSRMDTVIAEHNGFIDKYIGDALMALFSGPADDAVQAGIDMLETLKTYNRKRIKANYQPLRVGIGINTGSLMLGTVGGRNRMDSTVISDAVNLAARMEGLTKFYGAPLLIAENTFKRLRNYNRYYFRVIDRVKVKGKSVPVTVYEVFNHEEPALRDAKMRTKMTFEEGLLLYNNQRFAEAYRCFDECFAYNPDDLISLNYAQRSRR